MSTAPNHSTQFSFKAQVCPTFREQLADLEVKFSPKLASRILNQWIVCLHETLRPLHTAILQQKVEELKNVKLLKLEEYKQMSDTFAVDQTKENDTEPETCKNVLGEKIRSENNTIEYNERGNEQENVCDSDFAERKVETILGSDFPNNCDNESSKEVIEIDASEASAISDIIESTIQLCDPFQMSSEMHGDAVLLAILCFQHGVHGNPSKYIRPAERATANVESIVSENIKLRYGNKTTNETAEGTLVEDADIPVTYHIKVSESLIDGDQNVETTGTDECNPMEEDKEMGQLLKCYFYLFRDSISAIAKVIERSNHPKCHRWNAFIQCLAGTVIHFLA